MYALQHDAFIDWLSRTQTNADFLSTRGIAMRISSSGHDLIGCLEGRPRYSRTRSYACVAESTSSAKIPIWYRRFRASDEINRWRLLITGLRFANMMTL